MYARILVALDGSEPSEHAAALARTIARPRGTELLACHVYGAGLHGRRFREMEPGLPEEYQDERVLADLRGAHDSLIVKGFQSLSEGFVESFLAAASRDGLAARPVTEEGRNYVRLLEIAEREDVDLVALGATGLGAIGDGLLGSTTMRVLAAAPCDVLVARKAPSGGGVLVGVDGSPGATDALDRAAGWARALDVPLHLAAAYDPVFHKAVFRTLARALPAERHHDVGLADQEELHDRIINQGLATLYQGFLDEAVAHLNADGPRAERALLTGKAYRALADHARAAGADLVAAGRFGHHREGISTLGSNAEGLARTCGTNVLVVGGAGARPARSRAEAAASAAPAPAGGGPAGGMDWDAEAEARLGRIPAFARPMARRAIEAAVRARGGERVTSADMDEAARQFGMGQGGRA